MHLPRRLGRKLRNGQFQFTTNRAFQRVIRACAAPRGEELGTWITPEMIEAYCQLHQLGVAHSVEVWRDNDLVGGVYGVGFGGYFAAESMFHTASDASKAAVIHLAGHLQQQGFTLFDIQQWTPHMGRLGAQEIPRVVFLARLKKALEIDTLFDAS